MVKFQRETLSTCLEESKPLLIEHWKEIAHYDDIPLDPDEERYRNIEKSGMLRVYTVRTDDNHIVGYAVFIVNTNAHYKSSLQAVQDILFIHPSSRGMGGRFILWCDEQLKADGVQIVFQHLKSKQNFGKLLERFGYELIDLIYGKRLDK